MLINAKIKKVKRGQKQLTEKSVKEARVRIGL